MKSINVEEIFRSVDLDVGNCEKLIFEFFVAFARFEHRLVEAYYFERDERTGAVQVHWGYFENQCIEKAPQLTTSILLLHRDFLTHQPPRKLHIGEDGGPFYWQLPASEEISLRRRKQGNTGVTDLRDLTLFLRRVRNNLFHGSKCRDSNEQTVQRMKECLPIIADLNRLLKKVGNRVWP